MPRNEKERIIYIAVLCLLMTYFNGLLNGALIQGAMTKELFQKTDSENTKIFLLSFFMVLFMSPCVLLARMLIQCGFGPEAFLNVAKHWPRAFTFALFYQLIFAGPLARRILRLLRTADRADKPEVL